MNIGSYIKSVMEDKKISLKRLHEGLSGYFQSQGEEYVTYQRFCTKLSENAITAEELLVMCNLVDINIEKLISFAKTELSGDLLKEDEKDTILMLFRDYVNVYYDEEVVEVNDEENYKYLSKANAKLNPNKHHIISVSHIPNPSEEAEEKIIYFIGYSYETNEIVSERIDVKPSENTIRYRLFFYSDDFDVFLRERKMTTEKFEVLDLFKKYTFIDDIALEYLSFATKKVERAYPYNK